MKKMSQKTKFRVTFLSIAFIISIVVFVSTAFSYFSQIVKNKEEINKLSPLDRKLIISRYFEDKSQNETSKLLGISQVQVSRKENKILTKIKNNIFNN